MSQTINCCPVLSQLFGIDPGPCPYHRSVLEVAPAETNQKTIEFMKTTAKRHGLSSIQGARILVNMPALQNGLLLKQLGLARSRILTANLRSMIFCNGGQHEQELQP